LPCPRRAAAASIRAARTRCRTAPPRSRSFSQSPCALSPATSTRSRSRLDFVSLHAQSKPDAVAQIEEDRRVTWRELLERRNKVAGALGKLGGGRGEHVIVSAPNPVECLLASAATRAANAVPVPMNHRLVAEEVGYILENSAAVAAVVGGSFVGI